MIGSVIISSTAIMAKPNATINKIIKGLMVTSVSCLWLYCVLGRFESQAFFYAPPLDEVAQPPLSGSTVELAQGPHNGMRYCMADK